MSDVITLKDFDKLLAALNPDWLQFWLGIGANALLALAVALYAQRVIKRTELRKNEIADVRRFNALVASIGSFTESIVFNLEQLILPQLDGEKRHILAVRGAADIQSAPAVPIMFSVPKLPVFEADKYNIGMINLGSRVDTMLKICRIENVCNEFNSINERRNILCDRLSNGIACVNKDDFFKEYDPFHHSTVLLMVHAQTLLDYTLSMLAEISEMNDEHRKSLYELGVKNVKVSSLLPNQDHFNLLAKVRTMVDLVPGQVGRLTVVKDFVAPKLEKISFWEANKGLGAKIRQFVRGL